MKREKCEKCIHSAVCQELEEHRDPLGFISTKGEWVCSYYAGYRKASEVARDVFSNLKILGHIDFDGNFCIRKDSFDELEKIYTEGEK